METNEAALSSRLHEILERVIDDQEVVIVRREGDRDVAMLPAAELTSLLETAHLLRSPANARRLMTALRRADRRTVQPTSVEELRRKTGLTSEA